MTKELLTRTGYLVTDVCNGEEALKATVEFQPDLVLLDVDMPGVTGFESCRAINRTH